MINSDQAFDFIPISMLNALAYCPRRFGYEYLQAEMLVNEFVAEGKILHGSVDSGGRSWIDAGVQERSLYVWNNDLKIAGIVDLLEQRDGRLQPIEYKRGKLNRWRNDHVQLCAQALCLEAMFDSQIDQGYLFSWANRRRETVVFDVELRNWTHESIAAAHRISAGGILPPPLTQKAKCRDCSLQTLCLPAEVLLLQSRQLEHSPTHD